MEGKNIKVYGTLINLTLNIDSSMRDSQHNDLIAVAYQLFDERFNPKKGSGTNGAVINIDKYQDIINKRLTALSYDPNGDLTSLYSNLYVSGDTNIGGNIHVDGTSTFDGPAVFNNNVNITGNVNMNIGLNDLNDVVLSTMAVGQVLRYDGNKWVNSKLSIDDIQMPNASAGQVLKFNGTNWVADTDNVGLQGATTLDGLTGVDTTGKQNGDALIYDSTSGTWKPGTIGGGQSLNDFIEIVEVTPTLVASQNVQNNTYTQVENWYAYLPSSLDFINRVLKAESYCVMHSTPDGGLIDFPAGDHPIGVNLLYTYDINGVYSPVPSGVPTSGYIQHFSDLVGKRTYDGVKFKFWVLKNNPTT